MTTTEIRNEMKKLVLAKGFENITNGDCNELQIRTGASFMQVHKALEYFTYSPRTAKYRNR